MSRCVCLDGDCPWLIWTEIISILTTKPCTSVDVTLETRVQTLIKNPCSCVWLCTEPTDPESAEFNQQVLRSRSAASLMFWALAESRSLEKLQQPSGYEETQKSLSGVSLVCLLWATVETCRCNMADIVKDATVDIKVSISGKKNTTYINFSRLYSNENVIMNIIFIFLPMDPLK